MAYRRHTQAVLLDTTAVSSTTAYTSAWMEMSSFNTFGAQLVFTGTMTGTITLEVSYDEADPANPGQPAASASKAVSFLVNSAVVANIAVSGAATHVLETGLTSANFVRVKYTNATNSGTVKIKGVAKVVG